MFVEPARALVEWGDVVRLALPDAYRRDDEEGERCEPEEEAAEAAARDCADDTEEQRAGDDGEMEGNALRRVEARARLVARDDEQLDESRHESDVERQVRRDVRDVFRQAERVTGRDEARALNGYDEEGPGCGAICAGG